MNAMTSTAPEPALMSKPKRALRRVKVAETPEAVDAICIDLQELQVMRRFLITTRNRMNNATLALLRRLLGWTPVLPEKERDAIAAKAKKIKAAIEKGDDLGDDADWRRLGQHLPNIAVMCRGEEPFVTARETVEADMKHLVKCLPVYAWAKEVKGFGELGLAVVVGEAGNVSNYGTVSRLWKRLGLHTFKGLTGSTNARHGLLKKEEWTECGYSRDRLAQVYGCVTQSMVKAQWRGEKDGVPAHPIGPYGKMYGTKKAEYRERIEITADLEGPARWNGMRAEMAAQRYMVKKMLRDFWKEWQRRTPGGLKNDALGRPVDGPSSC